MRSINRLIEFGRKQKPAMGTINDESLKAALTGKLREGDIIKRIGYSGNLSKELDANVGNEEVAALLRRPVNYPITLTLERKVSSAATDQESNSLYESTVLNFNNSIE